ncbi:MAG: type II toxin-antitoxin system RelE/ParE family toxin [Saccharofermentans sp.]|nr:type II toxin-antitoxin system RelE/ParE family toxin [Saccharofermentans sp.]
MKQYRVRITEEALNDMGQLYKYIAVHLNAPKAAMDQYNRITEAIMSLSQMPKRIKLMDSEPERTKGLRRINVDNYSVFFLINKDEVVITNVLYGSMDISERLK